MDNRKLSRLRRWARKGSYSFCLRWRLCGAWINTESRHYPPALAQRLCRASTVTFTISRRSARSAPADLRLGNRCSICRYTTPAIDKLAKEGGNVVSIAMRSGDDEKLARWAEKKT